LLVSVNSAGLHLTQHCHFSPLWISTALRAMADLDPGRIDTASDGDDDDIARFERQCAERARAEGLLVDGDYEAEALSDDEDQHIRRARFAAGVGRSPTANEEWREKCSALQERLSRREAELLQTRKDLDLLKNDGVGPGDPGVELKQRLIELTKKNRRLQVTSESQKTRIQQLEAELQKPREEVRRQAEELAMQSNNNAMLGDGLEDWKKKYLISSNKLQEVRHEMQDLRTQLHRQKKVLLKEIGSEEALEKAIAVADDPAAVQWKGRAAQISQLQRQIRELREQFKNPSAKSCEDADLGSCIGECAATPQRMVRGQRLDPVVEKERAALTQVAEKRREEFEKLQEEVERLRNEQGETKRKREALKSRNSLIETQLRELKTHVQLLLRKSDDDDALVAALRRQLGRHGGDGGIAVEHASGTEDLEQENAELRGQLERQAQIVLQLRQKTMANTIENGSTRLGPKSAEIAASDRQLIERVRYLEVENARCNEQVRLIRERHGEEPNGCIGRPFSSESLQQRKEKLRQMDERLAAADRDNSAQRQRTDDARFDSSPSCRSSRSSSRGTGIAGMGGNSLNFGLANF